MKNSRLKGLNLTTYRDDFSRCVMVASHFKEAALYNAVSVLKDPIK